MRQNSENSIKKGRSKTGTRRDVKGMNFGSIQNHTLSSMKIERKITPRAFKEKKEIAFPKT